MNIIWKKPDNTVAVTHMTPEGAADMAFAAAQLARDKVAIVAAFDAAKVRNAELKAAVNALLQTPPTEGASAAEVDAYRAALNAAQAEKDAHDVVLNAASVEVKNIERGEELARTVGTTLAEHAAILQQPIPQPGGAAPAYRIDPTWQAVAFDIVLPADRDARSAWSWTTPAPVIDIDAGAVLAERKAAASAKAYRDVDALYSLAVGNRAEEYKQAEADARAYASAGYTGPVSPYVSGWAAATGRTNQQSADIIIARADALEAAKLTIRNQRFVSQSAMSSATTQAELDTAIAAWGAFVSATRTALA